MAEHRLSCEDLARCQTDPTLAWTIRGSRWVACVLDGCGALCESLGPHLRLVHKMTVLQYKQLPGIDGMTPRYSKNASLLSLDLRERLSKTRKKLKLGRRLLASGKTPPVEKLISSRGKRVLSQQYRIEQGRRKVGGRPDLWGKFRGKELGKRGEDWQIAKLAIDGASDSEIANAIGLKAPQSVGARRRGLGFHNFKKPRVYDHGRVLVGEDVRTVARDLKKTLQQMADDMGLKYKTVKACVGTARRNKPLSVLVGRAFKKRKPKWRLEFGQAAVGKQGGRPQSLLPNERERMAGEYNCLLPEMRALLNWISKRTENGEDVTLDLLRGWTYLQARKGDMRTLAMWPELFDWIEKSENKTQILRGNIKAFLMTEEFLADTYGVSAVTVRKALAPRSSA